MSKSKWKSYIKYLRKEPEEVKKFHSVLWAGVLTGVFSAFYLYFIYNIKPPLPEVNLDKTTTYIRDTNAINTETGVITETIEKPAATEGPFEGILNIIKEGFAKGKQLKEDIKLQKEIIYNNELINATSTMTTTTNTNTATTTTTITTTSPQSSM